MISSFLFNTIPLKVHAYMHRQTHTRRGKRRERGKRKIDRGREDRQTQQVTYRNLGLIARTLGKQMVTVLIR